GISRRDIAFTMRLQELSNQITRCSNIATTLMVLSAVLWMVSGRYEPLFLFVPAFLVYVVAELKMERMRQLTLEYLRELGIDVSDAPKPLLHSLRRLFSRNV